MADFQAEQALATLESIRQDLESASDMARVSAVRDALRWLGDFGVKNIPSTSARRLMLPDEETENDLRRDARRALVELLVCDAATARSQARSLSARVVASNEGGDRFSLENAESILRGALR